MIAGLNTDKRPSSPLATIYIQAGLLFLGAAALLMVMYAPQLVAPPKHNAMILVLAHFVLLGFGTLITFGALRQMIPVILGESIQAAERAGRTSLVLLVPGVLIQASGFAVWEPWLVIIGGSMVVAGTITFSYPYALPLLRRLRRDVTALYITFAILSVHLTVIVGVLLALQLKSVWSIRLFWNGLPVHMLLGVFGWFTGIIIGVSYKLFPMFTTSSAPAEHKTKRVFFLYYGGLAVATAAMWIGWYGGLILGLAVVAVGVAAYTLQVYRIIQKRLRRRLGPGMTQSAAAVGYLAIATVASGALFFTYRFDAFSPLLMQRLIVVAGLAFTLGWIGNMVMGMLSKIVPMLVWLEVYSHRVGDASVPSLVQMIDEQALWCGTICYQIGLLAVFAAIAAGSVRLTLTASAIFLFGVLHETITIFRVWFVHGCDRQSIP